MNSDSTSIFTLPPDSTLLHHQVYLKEGVAGTPQPYNVRTDNVLTMALLLSFVLFLLALAKSGCAVARQAKNFFFPSHQADDDSSLHPSPFTLLLFMTAVDSLLLAIGSYIYATECLAVRFALSSQPLAVAVLFAAFLAYFLVKWLAYHLVNSVFFGSKKTRQWTQTFLFVTALEGVLMFPLVMLLVYFDLSAEKALFYFVFVLILNKILTFYKCWVIFFRQNGRSLQIFLYFCALEITPLLAFGGVWTMMVSSLKVNF